VKPVLDYYAERTPGSFIEEQEVHLTFHYRNEPEFGSLQSRELHMHLVRFRLAAAANTVILPG
jgi:trehalose 6-phosphate synthase/phosphatase